MEILLIIIVVYCLHLYYKNKKYKEGSYYQITKNTYFSVKYDKGKYGEYQTYLSLRQFEADGCKLLFNVYIPKGNNKTTEIDVLLISPKGIFVFECKNYSGWIFGDESQSRWTQTLPQGRGRSHKEYFYNPIRQNAWHIAHLKKLLGNHTTMQSIIVFSNRCTLKKITVRSDDVTVTKNYNVANVVSEIHNQSQKDIYSKTEINDIYDKLHPYTQLDYDIKKLHVEHVHHVSNTAVTYSGKSICI